MELRFDPGVVLLQWSEPIALGIDTDHASIVEAGRWPPARGSEAGALVASTGGLRERGPGGWVCHHDSLSSPKWPAAGAAIQ